MPRDPMRDVIVLLPGIIGSRLVRNGRTVWGYSAAAVARTLLTGGGSMCADLMLASDPADGSDPGDGVVADATIPDLHLLPHFWKIDGYGRIASFLRAVFDVEVGHNYFEFPYDWRRDNRAAAARLLRDSGAWLKAWQERSGNKDARLILVAHSMGGLVARYFLECHDGWRTTRALITFGTPYRGALNALDTLSNGMRIGLVDLSPAMRSFTSVYQLLPIYPCYDPGSGRLARIGEVLGAPAIVPDDPVATLNALRRFRAGGPGGKATAALANIDAIKVLDALIFHYEILAAAHVHAQQEEYRAKAYRVCPVVGIAQVTGQQARDNSGSVLVEPQYEGRDLGGDGTVPRVSAEPPGRESGRDAMFAATKHGSLQNADAVLNHLRGLINSFYLDLGGFLAPPTTPPIRVALEVPDIVLGDQGLHVRARPTEPAALRAIVRAGATNKIAAQFGLQPADGCWHEAVYRGLPPGEYRLEIAAGEDAQRVETAADAFVVAGDAGV